MTLDGLRDLPWKTANEIQFSVSSRVKEERERERGKNEKRLTSDRVELHTSLDLEASRILVRSNSNENQPLSIMRLSVVDDLTSVQTW